MNSVWQWVEKGDEESTVDIPVVDSMNEIIGGLVFLLFTP